MWTLADKTLNSRLLLGSAQYPSPQVMRAALQASRAEVVTVSLRRSFSSFLDASCREDPYWRFIRESAVLVLPNTAGCQSAREAVTVARMARELLDTHWIKLEVIADDDSLAPNLLELVTAAEILIREGFEVFPYTTTDLSVADRLLELGCKILMPWGAPIGSGQGLIYKDGLQAMHSRYPEVTLIVDAGIGQPSHAAEALEIGFDAVLLNTAVAQSRDPVRMAQAFALAIESGRLGFESGMISRRASAQPSTPVVGVPFWQGQGLEQ